MLKKVSLRNSHLDSADLEMYRRVGLSSLNLWFFFFRVAFFFSCCCAKILSRNMAKKRPTVTKRSPCLLCKTTVTNTRPWKLEIRITKTLKDHCKHSQCYWIMFYVCTDYSELSSRDLVLSYHGWATTRPGSHKLCSCLVVMVAPWSL